MKQFYIRLKEGQSARLNLLVARHLALDLDEAEKLIAYGSVWNHDNKQRIKDRHYHVTGETIVVNRPVWPVREYPFSAEDIIYQDDHLFVLYKKPFFQTVPTPYADISSLVFGFNCYLQSAGSRLSAFAVNRLDLCTSGLVIMAAYKACEVKLHALFKSRRIKKWYMVKTAWFSGYNQRYFIEDIVEWKGKARRAKTVVSFLRADGEYCYFLALPRTGRTHQIRKHFARYIHPVYGDPTYGHYHREIRLGLICFCYIFRHPVTGRKMVIKYLPDDFCSDQYHLPALSQ